MKKGNSSVLRRVTNNKVQLAYELYVAFSPQSIKCDFWKYSHALVAEAKHAHHSNSPPSQDTRFPLKCYKPEISSASFSLFAFPVCNQFNCLELCSSVWVKEEQHV